MASELRPEVRAFAEAMQRLLDKHQAVRGDAWKHDSPRTLIASTYRKVGGLFNSVDLALRSGQLSPSVLESAASVGAHAMFVADVMGALDGESAPTKED